MNKILFKPNARLYMRPIQLHLLHWWKPVSRDLDARSQSLNIGTLELVVTGSQHSKGQIIVSRPYKQSDCHGCIKSGMGWQFGPSDCTGHLVNSRETIAYKLSGDGGVILTIRNFLQQLGNQSVLIRSDNSTVVQYINRQGGYSVSTIVLQSLGTLANGNRKKHISERGSDRRENEYSPGPVEQDCNKDNQMDLERFGVTENFSNLGEANDRSLCFISQEEDGHLLHLGPASPCILSNFKCTVDFFYGERLS